MKLEVQLLTMGHMVGAGMYIGIIYDTYFRVWARPARRWVEALQDVLFWLANALLIFIWLKNVNDGQVRLYIFLALLLGFAIYKALFQRLYKYVLEKCIMMIVTTINWTKICLNSLIIRPLLFLIHLVVGLLLFFSRPIVKICARFLHSINRRLFFRPEDETLETEVKEGFWKRVANWFKKE